MENTAISNELQVLEKEILRYRESISVSFYEIGRRLVKAKDLLGHGKWLEWLENNVNFSRYTANKLMRVATEFPNVESIQHLGKTKAMALLDLPIEEREQFIEETHEVDGEFKSIDDMSVRELKRAIKHELGVDEEPDDEKQMVLKEIKGIVKDLEFEKLNTVLEYIRGLEA